MSGATIQLYAVGTTGDGSAATPLLTNTVTTDANGGFRFGGEYTCPSPTALVYIVATGGNPGLSPGSNNASLSMMAALGACNTLASTFININELTTVGAVAALAPFMVSPSNIGSSISDAPALADAFALASTFVNNSTGTVPGINVPAGATVPVAQINTLADILSSCINSAGGVAGDSSNCGDLFALTTPSNAVPATDTITAALHIAQNSTLNTTALFNLVLPTSPFQPQLTQPPSDLSVHLILPSVLSLSISPAALAFPTTVIGFASEPQTITLTNTGQTQIVLSGISLVGTNSGDFSQTNNCPISLAISASCSTQIVFTPSAAGSRSASLFISSNAVNSQQSIALTGEVTVGSTAGPITVSPSQLNFSQVNVPQTVTLTNQGSTPLAIGSISAGSNYSQTNNCGNTLDAQSICNISVSATTLNYSVSGTLTIADDAATGPQTVSLQTSNTTGLPASSISFGPWAVGTTSPVQTLAATRGCAGCGATFQINSVIGANASDFSAAGSCSDPYQCRFPVTFTPSALGMRSATLITNLGDIPVSGIGTPAGPSFTLSWTSPPNFTSQGLNTNSGVYNASLSNNGTTSLQLSGSVSGANASDFTVGNQCTSALTQAQVCSMTLSYKPTQLGTFADTFTVTDANSGVQQVFSFVSGSIPSPPTANPSSLTFGNVQVGATSAPMSFIVTAPAGDPVIANVLQYGGTPSGFAITQGATCATTPCTVTVTMTPNATLCCGTNIEITDTVTHLGASVSVLGTGGVPIVSLSPSALSFPARTVGSTSIAQQVTLTNLGNARLVINSISLTGTNPGDFIQSNGCTSLLYPNTQCTLSISFSPTAGGTRTATVQILSNSSTSPDTISLSGTAN